MAKTLKTNTKQLIIDSTMQLIGHRNAEEISLSDIAEAAGITKGTLFYYYNSKDLIFMEITYRYLNDLYERFDEWITDSKKDTSYHRMAKYIIDFGARGSERSKLHVYLINKAISSDKHLIEVFRSKYAEWKNNIRARIAERLPEEDSREADILAELFLIVVDGLIIQDLVGISGIETKDIVPYLNPLKEK